MPIGGHCLPIFFISNYMSAYTHTNTGLSVFRGKLKTHAVKYSETAGTQSEATVGPKNTDRMTSDKDKLYLDVSVSICLTV